jgi:tripartite-type tricarboxylate transporter receptor subunit TctC
MKQSAMPPFDSIHPFDRRRRDLLVLGLSLGTAAMLRSPPAAAAEGQYPEYPIRLIAPRSAGGVVDTAGRVWADRMTHLLGTSIVIENQTGGGGTLGATMVARAKPDGYTLLAGTASELVISYLIASTPPFDPIKDFAPITINAVAVAAIMVHESVPAHTLQELVAYAKANPGKLVYGSAGTGTTGHLCGELFKSLAGLPDIVHVPYRGAAAGLMDLYSGQIPMMVASVSTQTLAMQKSGKIRILVAAAERHLTGAPEVPIGADVGFPDLIAQMFMGVLAPAATPTPVITKIADASRTVMSDKDFQAKLVEGGFEPVLDCGPAQSERYIKAELTRWAPIVKSAGLTLN